MNNQKSNDLAPLVMLVVFAFFAALAIFPVMTVLFAKANPVRFKKMKFTNCLCYGAFFAGFSGLLGAMSTLQWGWLGESLYQVGKLQIDHRKILILVALNSLAVSVLLFTIPVWTKVLIKKTDLRRSLF